MVVEAIANPKMIDDDDDDDAPLVFRRRDISKQRQLNSESKVRASAQSDKLSGKVHNGRDSNDRASSAPKGKVVQASKPTSSKLPVSTLSGKISPLKSTSQTPSSSRGRDDDDDDDDDTCLVFKRRDKSLQHQLNPEQKVRDSAQANKPLERVQDARSSNDQASCALKGKMVQASKPSSSVLPAVQKSSTLSGKISPLKSTPQPPSSSLSRDDDDDDDCIVFKRRDKSIQQHQLNPEQKVRDLAQANKPLEKVQDARSSNDHATCALKGKMVQASKPLSSVLPAVQKSSPLSGKISPLKSTPQPPSSSLSRDGNKIRTEKLVTVKDEKPSKEVAKEKTPLTSDSEDSEDEKPLSSRLSIKKSIANPGNKQRGSSSKSLNGNYSDLSDDDKPLAAKLLQNGFIKRENQTKKPSVVPAKRPSTASSSDQSSAKKLKPLSQTTTEKAKMPPMKSEIDDENDNIPIAQRMKQPNVAKKSETFKQKVTKVNSSSFKKKGKKNIKKVKNQSKFSRSSKMLPGSGDGQKWTTLVHSGVIFPPPYSPHGVKILYDGKPVDLTPEQEEVATMYAVMLDTDYIQKEKFNENFFGDWKKILGRNHVIKDLKKCDFTPIQQWHLCEKEKKKQMTTEEKKTIKEEKLKQEEKYMWAIVDGVKEKVGNFRVEPPGLFRGRGEHPKMGKLKKRILPSDITLNIGKGVPVPECPIAGERWKEIRHDNTVTWLAFWNDPINPKEFKYVFLAASSTLKGQSDKEKYEKARMLKDYIQGIRAAYTKDFTSKDMTKRQIAVATYLIDRLALRAGNEKDDDEADTVGCCTLKVENVSPLPPNILEFDFLGKDSIRYHKQFEAEPLVFNAVEIFRKGKKGSDDLFDMLDTSKLNAHLKELMPGLTAKVFRTYNASITLDDMLSKGAEDGDLAHKVCRYQVANKEVAIICNHQRSVSKSHNAQMERLTDKIKELKDTLSELETDLSRAKKGKPPLKDENGKQKKNLTPEAIGKKIEQTKAKIDKMERDMKSKEDLKEIALGTSRINYLDPRITVAWCKRNEVPIEKIFNKSLLAKFAWSMDCDPTFRF